jgi:hypothetical protein
MVTLLTGVLLCGTLFIILAPIAFITGIVLGIKNPKLAELALEHRKSVNESRSSYNSEWDDDDDEVVVNTKKDDEDDDYAYWYKKKDRSRNDHDVAGDTLSTLSAMEVGFQPPKFYKKLY